jgi:uncharacterized cupin superfamily protein
MLPARRLLASSIRHYDRAEQRGEQNLQLRGAEVIAHWEEIPADGDLAQAAGAVAVSVRRIELAAGKETQLPKYATEDVLFVVAGGTDELRAGDCVVYPVPHEAPMLRAGGDGLTALVFATPAQPPPFHSGTSEPPRKINVADADSAYEGDAGRWVVLARQAGAQHAGVNFGRLEAGHDGAPPHCHSADEELFVFLEGSATFDLWPSALSVLERGAEKESLQVRAGHVVSRPPSTGVSHSVRANDTGVTFLVYGTRRPNDVCYYPRSNKIYWRGLGLIARLDPLTYDDGEPED